MTINFYELKEDVLNNLVVSLNKNCMSSKIADQQIILNSETSIYFGLNKIGSWIWSQLENGKSIGQIKQMAVSDFDVSANDFAKDLIEFLQKLADEGIITQ